MMLTSIYHIILSGEHFNPCDYESLKNTTVKKVELTPSIALEYLASIGVDISNISIPPLQTIVDIPIASTS